MGACGSKVSRVDIDVDAQNWSQSYKHLNPDGFIVTHSNGDRSMDEKTEVVLNSAGRLASVNGYEVSKQLGKGAFGEVYLASRGGEQFALKIIKKAALKKTSMPGRPGTKQSPAALDLVKAEIATLKKIGHPNCVQMFDVIYDATVDQVFLVLEFVDGGTSQKSDAEGHPILLPERTIWSHTRHFVMGLEYLHMQGIVRGL